MPLAERLGRTKVLKMADAFSQNLGMSENNETTHMNGLAAVIGEPFFPVEDVRQMAGVSPATWYRLRKKRLTPRESRSDAPAISQRVPCAIWASG